MKRVALVTCLRLPEPDPDETLLLDALRAKDIDVEMLAWDDERGDPGSFDVCVIRSSWNWARHPDSFREWIRNAAQETKLLNPDAAVEYGHHKRYLQDLEQRGVAVVPTRLFDRGETVSLRDVADDEGWDDVVVKPAVSAASMMTSRARAGEFETGQRQLDRILAERDAMIQPYVEAADRGGERALVWIDGMCTHAVTKRPRFAGGEESVSGAQPIEAVERIMVEHALGDWADKLLYARVDVMPDASGAPMVSELEIIEPSLFLLEHAPALDRFVRAIIARA